MTPFDLLFVCTGNICRSPTAHLVAAAGLPADRFRVHSAGTYGLTGDPIERNAARLLRDRGIGCDEFRARRLTAELVRGADLVLTATRDHRAAVVALVPEAEEKAFTIRELARLVADVTGADDPRALVAEAAARRDARAEGDADDVDDPYGLGAAAYERAFAEISEALDRPLRLLGRVSRKDAVASGVQDVAQQAIHPRDTAPKALRSAHDVLGS